MVKIENLIREAAKNLEGFTVNSVDGHIHRYVFNNGNASVKIRDRKGQYGIREELLISNLSSVGDLESQMKFISAFENIGGKYGYARIVLNKADNAERLAQEYGFRQDDVFHLDYWKPLEKK